MRKYRAIFVVVGLLLAVSSWGAGPRFHAESGIRAWKNHLTEPADMLPGLPELWNNSGFQRAFIDGCQFPDWGYRGVNQDAGEDSHWLPYHEAYFSVLREKYPLPWGDDAKRRIGFFFGLVCHSVVDIPYHFDDGANLGFLGKALREDGLDHGQCETHTDIYTCGGCGPLIELIENPWWPIDDILAAYGRTARRPQEQEVERGRREIRTGCMLIGLFGAVPMVFIQKESPWTGQHYEDYYFGGLNQGAALTAVMTRYWYARLNGWQFLTNIDRYGMDPKGFFSQAPCADTSIHGALPDNNAGGEPCLMVGNSRTEGVSRILIKFDTKSVPTSTHVRKATLWLHTLPKSSAELKVQIFNVKKPWNEGNQVTNEIDGLMGLPAQPEEADYSNSTALETDQAPVATSNVVVSDSDGGWVSWDVTPSAQSWIDTPERNCGLLLKSADELATDSFVQFVSSEAFRVKADGYGGGIRVAQRPTLVIMP